MVRMTFFFILITIVRGLYDTDRSVCDEEVFMPIIFSHKGKVLEISVELVKILTLASRSWLNLEQFMQQVLYLSFFLLRKTH